MLGEAAGSSATPIRLYQSIVCVATRLRDERVGVRILVGEAFLTSICIQTVSVAHPASSSVDTGVISRGVERPESDGYSSVSNAEDKVE
jgi:hypothetical protein